MHLCLVMILLTALLLLKKLTKLCGKQVVKLALSICLLDITMTHVCFVILLVARSIKASASQTICGSKTYDQLEYKEVKNVTIFFYRVLDLQTQQLQLLKNIPYDSINPIGFFVKDLTNWGAQTTAANPIYSEWFSSMAPGSYLALGQPSSTDRCHHIRLSRHDLGASLSLIKQILLLLRK